MGVRRSQTQPPPQEIKIFTPDEIRQGITKIRRRIDEVTSLKSAGNLNGDQRVENAQNNIRSTILEVYGPNSPEFQQHQHYRIWHGPMSMGMDDFFISKALIEGCSDAIVMLEGLVTSLNEKLQDHAQDPRAVLRDVFRGLPIHPRIADACVDTFNDGHYREAVLNGSIALVNFVKEKSGRHDIDGATLMRTAFSKNGPILAFNALQSQTDLDEQEGLMHLFEGAVMALRNPRAHDTVPDVPEVAVEYLALLSLLAKRLESTKRVKIVGP